MTPLSDRPCPETEAATFDWTEICRGEAPANSALVVDAALARSLEQRLGAAIEALEELAFHRGEWKEVEHIEYCDFCNYSRGYIAVHGHGKTCVLYRAALPLLREGAG